MRARSLLAALIALFVLTVAGCGKPDFRFLHPNIKRPAISVTPAPKPAVYHQTTSTVFASLRFVSGPSSPAPGDVLITSPGQWSGSPTGFVYAWMDCDSAGANCTTASGSPTNTQRYVIVAGDAGSTIRVAVTASYTGHPDATVMSAPTSVVSGSSSTAFNDPLSGSSVATGPNQWTVVDNTLGNDNATFQCDRADHAAEGSGVMTETISSGSFTCPGPVGGNGGITSCPSSTCSTTKAGAEVTMRNQAFRFGTISITAKVAGDGSPDNAWPVLWLLGPNCQHPQLLVTGADPPTCSWHSTGSEEVDIAEWATGVRTSFTCSVYSNSGMDAGVGSSAITDASSNFHTYEFDWTSGGLATKVDGSTACTLSNADAPSGLEMLVLSAQMGGTSMPSQPVTSISNISITPAGPDITSQANWPAVTGSTTHGSVLSVSNGTWTGSPTGFTYRWLQCNTSGLLCNVISGATASTYTTVSGDIGHTIQAEVTASNASGATQYGSNLTATVS